jgi:HPt (histidine-containing phosphotransfer) domain-containing protein
LFGNRNLNHFANVVNDCFTILCERLRENGVDMMSLPRPSAECPIDMVHLARQTAGDSDLEREVLALFRDQCARLLALIAASARQGVSRDEVSRDAVHTLKGAALGIGAFGVARAAESIEQASARELVAAIAVLQKAVAEASSVIEQLMQR